MMPQANGAADRAERERHWRWALDRPIAVLRQEPDELERVGVVFEDDYDELDYLRHAPIRGASGRLYALVRHRGSPVGGTQIVTHCDSPHPATDVDEVLAALGLERADMTWTHPDAERGRDHDVGRSSGRLFAWLALVSTAIVGLIIVLVQGLSFMVALVCSASLAAGYGLRLLVERHTPSYASRESTSTK